MAAAGCCCAHLWRCVSPRHHARAVVQATVFKELAAMVIDQGTIIDRIDYNMEQVGLWCCFCCGARCLA